MSCALSTEMQERRAKKEAESVSDSSRAHSSFVSDNLLDLASLFSFEEMVNQPFLPTRQERQKVAVRRLEEE